MAANPGFPLSLDVRGYPVLVLGGDEEAAEKTQRLLEAGATPLVLMATRKWPQATTAGIMTVEASG